MKINRIILNNFRGRNFDFAFDKPNVALLGPVGAGKTSTIQALRLGVGLPTPWGEKNLSRLSPNGRWKVFVDIDGHVYSRSVDGSKSSYEIDGQGILQTDYMIAMSKLGFGDQYVDLTSFLELSGQKKAELFSSLLDTKPVSLADAIKAATGKSFATLASERDAAAGDVADASGTPGELVDCCRAIITDLKSKEKSLASHYKELLGQPKPKTEPIEPMKAKLAEINRRRGEIAATLEGITKTIRAKTALKGTIETTQAACDRLREHVRVAKDEAIPGLQSQIAKLNEEAASWALTIDSHVSKLAEVNAAIAAIEQEPVPSAMRKIGDLGAIPPVPLQAAISMASACGLQPAEMSMDTFCDQLLELVVKPWLKAYETAAEMSEVDAKAAKSEQLSRLNAARKARTEIENGLTTARSTAMRIDWSIKDKQKELENAQKTIAGNEQQIVSYGATIQRLTTEAQSVIVEQDSEVLQAELVGIKTTATELEASIRSAESAMVAAGQTDRARANHLLVQNQIGLYEELLEKLQLWRDKIMAEQIDRVTGPFRAALAKCFGKEVGVKLSSSGSGRSTVFDFSITRGKWDVPLDQLSAGETSLTAAAFLSAVHEMRGSKARIFTLDAEALDVISMRNLLRAIPELGFDFAAIASNRIDEDGLDGKTWNAARCGEANS